MLALSIMVAVIEYSVKFVFVSLTSAFVTRNVPAGMVTVEPATTPGEAASSSPRMVTVVVLLYA